MKLASLLTEKIYISAEEQDKLHKVFNKWLANIRTTYADEMHNINYIIMHDYEKIVDSLRRALLPTIRHILTPYLPSKETMQHYFDQKKIRYEKQGRPWGPENSIEYFLGHKLSINIEGYQYSLMRGGVYPIWQSQFVGKNNDKTSKLTNTLYLNIPTNTLEAIVKNPNITYIVDNWVATLTHEIIHLIQSVKSKTQSITGRAISSYDDTREQYLSEPSEIAAFAQTVASKIISHAKRYDDPIVHINGAIQGIKMGMRQIFNHDLFKGEEYDEFKKIFKEPTGDLKVKKERQKVWRSFQKALISKLIYYKEHL